MKTETIHRTYNRLELLKRMFLSREGDRREGLLLRQGKDGFTSRGPAMNHWLRSACCSGPMIIYSPIIGIGPWCWPAA